MSLQVLPVVPEDDIYDIVDKVIKYIDGSGVKYEVGPMETTMEGDFDFLLEIVKESRKICVKRRSEQGSIYC